jgi:hypothetical protein
MEVLIIALSIISAIMMWRLIGFGVRTANKINHSTEASVAALQALYDAMPPEAKARAGEASEQRQIDRKQAEQERMARIGWALLAIAGFVAFSYLTSIIF